MKGVWRSGLLIGAALTVGQACGNDFDTTRRAPVRGTLGEEIFGVLCDRVGASVLAEDYDGSSYRQICHGSAAGWATEVDESQLPPPETALDPESRVRASAARALAVSKLRTMARRRADLVRALDATFDDREVDVPFEPGKKIKGHAALSAFLRSLVPLYDSNPIDPAATEPLMPSTTRAVSRVFAGLGGPADASDPFTNWADAATAQAAQASLARLSGRQGYRPSRFLLGALRPTLAYPDLRRMAQTLAPRIAPGGSLREGFQQILAMTKDQLSTSVTAPLPPPYTVDATYVQPNRPRTNVEAGAAFLLATDPVYADPALAPSWVLRRDVRGYGVPAGAIAGVPGSVTGPFGDADNDGQADVDGLGRFLGPDGQLAAVDPPFAVGILPRLNPPDALGRALSATGQPLFAYFDAQQTVTAGLGRDLVSLIDPDSGTETVADLLSGSYPLYGDPITVDAPWGPRPGFDVSKSPIVDLLHGSAQILSHPQSDAALGLLESLFRDHEPAVARVIGAALKIRDVSNAHPEAALAPANPFWDELIDVLVRVINKPALFKDVVRGLKDPRMNTTLARAFGQYVQFRDVVNYNPNDLNGGPINESQGDQVRPPSLPVDRTLPDALLADGTDNRSIFHRVLQMIHDMNGVTTCNKDGAKVNVTLAGIDLSWPLVGSYKPCELLEIHDIGLVYLDSVLDRAYSRTGNAAQGKMEIVAGDLNGLLNLLGGAISVDQVFEQSSGLSGLSLNPTPEAFHRLVYFGSTSSKYDQKFGSHMPDRDPFVTGKNAQTEKFISSLIDPLSTSVCSTRNVQVTNTKGPHTVTVADCGLDPQGHFDLLRVRDHGGILQWEFFDFLNGVAPLAYAFDKNDESQLFLDLLEVLYRHWPSAAHGAECAKTGSFDKASPNYNPKFCSESGLSAYEPILEEVFNGDFLPALGDLVSIVDATSIVDTRANRTQSPPGPAVPRNGTDLLHTLTIALLDPDYAASVGVKGRDGLPGTTRADGSAKPQATPMDLIANSLRAVDERLGETPRHARWRSARSKLVDTFLGVEGSGTGSRFVNRSTPPAIVTLVRTLREQLNANCPDRETTGKCPWAEGGLAQKAANTMADAPFSTSMATLEQLNEDPEGRAALQRLLRYLLQQATTTDVGQSTLTSITDMLQLLGDDQNLPPLYNAIAQVAAPHATDHAGRAIPGACDRVFEFVDAVTREDGKRNPYDPYHSLDRILANLVTPLDAADPTSQTPIEVFLDVAAEINREDASQPAGAPLTAQDFAFVFGTLRDFMTGRTRGLEQFYEIMKHRNGE